MAFLDSLPVGEISPASPGTTLTTFDLAEYGPTDWAYWNTEDPSDASGVPTNERSGATLIGSVSPVGGGSLRGTTSAFNSGASYDFSGGTSPVSGSVTRPTGLFNSQLDADGSGVSFSVTLPTLQTHEIYVWAAAFNVTTGTLTASLSGATNYVSTGIFGDTGPVKNTFLYKITATPDMIGDEVSFSIVNTDSGGSSGNILISAVAVAAVPEPGSAGLWLGGMSLVFLLSRRRRR